MLTLKREPSYLMFDSHPQQAQNDGAGGGELEEADQDGHPGHRRGARPPGRPLLLPQDDAHLQVGGFELIEVKILLGHLRWIENIADFG